MMPFSPQNRHLTFSIIAIVASLMVVAIGVQAYLAQQDNAARDRARAAQDRRDREYAACLTEFGNKLVTTIERRSRVRDEGTAALAAAFDKKDKALDRLLAVTARLTDMPPRATAREFRDVLADRVRAQHHYDRVAVRVEQRLDMVKRENQYRPPKAVCKR